MKQYIKQVTEHVLVIKIETKKCKNSFRKYFQSAKNRQK